MVETRVLTDRDRFPTQEIIDSHIGAAKELWVSLFEHLHQNYPEFTEQWRYYSDGKSWLLKVSKKTKTIFWLSVVPGSFRTTFYFTANAEQAISGSRLSDDLKVQFKSGKRYNKIRGITILHTKKRDVEDAKRLIAIKIAMK